MFIHPATAELLYWNIIPTATKLANHGSLLGLLHSIKAKNKEIMLTCCFKALVDGPLRHFLFFHLTLQPSTNSCDNVVSIAQLWAIVMQSFVTAWQFDASQQKPLQYCDPTNKNCSLFCHGVTRDYSVDLFNTHFLVIWYNSPYDMLKTFIYMHNNFTPNNSS